VNVRSIKFRLVAWYAGLLTGIFLLLCVSLYLDLRSFLENGLRETQARRARQLGNALLAHVPQTGEPYVLGQIKDWYAPESNDRFIRITRAGGTLVYVSDAPKDGAFDPSEVPIFPPPRRASNMRTRVSSASALVRFMNSRIVYFYISPYSEMNIGPPLGTVKPRSQLSSCRVKPPATAGGSGNGWACPAHWTPMADGWRNGSDCESDAVPAWIRNFRLLAAEI